MGDKRMTLEIHRDIYSGIVAEELNKDGYFGREYQIYGFLCFKDGKMTLETASDEESCAEMFLSKLKEGYMLSKYILIKRRIYFDETSDDVRQTLITSLSTELDKTYANDLLKHGLDTKEIDIDLQLQIVNYFSNLSPIQIKERKLPLSILLGQLTSNGRMEKSIFLQLQDRLNSLSNITDDKNKKQYYGFTYYKDGEWKLYTNAYFPAVLQKWFNYREQKILVSGLVEKSYSLKENWRKIKGEFEEYVLSILDEELIYFFLCLC